MEKSPLSPAELYTNFALYIVLDFLILFGNTLIVTAYTKNRRLRTGSNTIILSLAISDIFVGLVSVPVWCYLSLTGWQSDKWVSVLFFFFDILSAGSSTLHLAAVTVERFIAVSRPFYHVNLTPRVYHATVTSLWVVATSMAASNIILTRWFRHYGLLLLLGLVLGSLFVIVSMNVGIFKIARSLIHSSPPQQPGHDSVREVRRKIRQETKTAVTLLIVTVLFFFAWLPHVSVALIFTFCTSPCNMTTTGLLRLGAFVKWMQFGNSAVNPFVFGYRNSEMRLTFSYLLGSCGRHVFSTNAVHPSTSERITHSNL